MRRNGALLENKLIFNSYYSQRGIAVPKLYGMFHPVYGSDVEGNSLRTAEDLRRWLETGQIREFVVKPLAGAAGAGVLVLEVKDKKNIAFADREGREYTPEDLVAFMSQPLPYREQGFILEERVTGHPDVSKYNPSSVNTCRVVTFMDYQGEIHLLWRCCAWGCEVKYRTTGIPAASPLVSTRTGIIGEGVVRPKSEAPVHAPRFRPDLCRRKSAPMAGDRQFDQESGA